MQMSTDKRGWEEQAEHITYYLPLALGPLSSIPTTIRTTELLWEQSEPHRQQELRSGLFRFAFTTADVTICVSNYTR
jgi:hypothetical protein